MSVCIWVLMNVGTFFGGTFSLAVQMLVSQSATSCMQNAGATGCVKCTSLVCPKFWRFSLAIFQVVVLCNVFTVGHNSRLVVGEGEYGFYLLHPPVFIYFLAASLVDVFSFPTVIILFPACTDSFTWSVERGIRRESLCLLELNLKTCKEETGDSWCKYGVKRAI